MSKAWIDIGKSEKTPGVSYVAISRVRTLSSCVVEPMTFERLTSLKSSATLTYRLDEEARLDKLANATCSGFNHTHKCKQYYCSNISLQNYCYPITTDPTLK